MKIQILTLAFLPYLCHAALVGGNTEIKVNASDPNVVFALNAINDYYLKQGDNTARTVVSVVKAESQVVAGVLYHFTLRLQVGTETELCKVNVWSRPWLSSNEASQLSGDPACKSEMAPVKVGGSVLAGGVSSVDPNSKEVQAALSFAVDTLNAQENNLYRRKAVGMTSVTQQVVAGMLYNFKGVSMANTGCTKGVNTPIESCQVAAGADTKTCDFEISWQAWMTPQYKLLKFNCQ